MVLGGHTDNPAVLSETIALDSLSDVTITSAADNELLAYDSGTSTWINQTVAEAGLDSIYLKQDGTTPLTANWDAGSFRITAETLESDVVTGTAPFVVASTTLVTNLNADLLDGKNTGTSGNVIPLLDGANTWSGAQTFSGATKLLFRDPQIFIYSNLDGEMTIEADSKVTIGVAGDTVLGDGTQRDIRPQTDLKMDLGTSSFRFNEAWINELHVQVSTNNVSNPPTDAELDTAFGTPATVGEGFVGIVDDNNLEANIWLCTAIGTTWWYAAMTKAV